MAEELEEMWKKLSFIEVEDESISLGSRTTEAARNLGKNCLVMKVLSHKSINIDALRKNLRMIWKPQKCIQINEVEDERYLVEFGDGWDKKRIMEMCPWTYEKYLILVREFEGEQVPKDISLWQSPFWVQIHNLPLKSRTRETAPRRGGGDSTKVGHEEGRANRGWAASKPEGSKTRVTHAPKEGSGVGTEPESTQAPLGTCVIENETRKEGLRGQVTECEHETGKGSCIGEKAKGITTTSGKEGKRGLGTQNEAIEVMQWETGTLHGEANVFEFQMAPTKEGIQNIKAQKVKEHGSGPMALCYKDNIGWVAEHLGPKSGHWKRIKREACEAKPKENMGPGTRKRAGISVPCDGRSGGLAMIWRDGVDVRFMSCSHSHIDVVVHGEGGACPWRATGFYGHPDASMRHTSWELLETLKKQSTLPWVVFGNFNEIVHSEEKLGWLDRDADQMRNFRECLSTWKAELIKETFLPHEAATFSVSL
ncbi:hypothetical protein CFP56_021109 [Quercus suber]|uniref:DUF4283 domain-containing protein n=1 Tax=Quercus suber TaxID=58331 RepID=A0AAW0KFX4_QUESU